MQSAPGRMTAPIQQVPSPAPQTFPGQQPGERIVLYCRSFWLRLVVPALPIALGIGILSALLALQTSSHWPVPAVFWNVLQILVGIVTLLLLGRWAIVDAYPWWVRIYIVTNQRVISSMTGFTVAVQEIALRDIQSVRVESQTFIEWIFGFGRLSISAAGGTPLRFLAIRAPRSAANLIMQTREAHAPAVQQTTSAPDPAMRQVLDSLAQATPLPVLATLPPAISIEWPLRRAVNVPLEAGETILGIISRHWWALAEAEARPLLIFMATGLVAYIGAFFVWTFTGPIIIAGGVLGLVWALLAYLNFADDIYLLTTRRIIDVDRRFFVLFETSLAIEYSKIQEIKTTVPNIWARFIKYGDLTINVAGGGPAVTMESVPHPQAIAQAIEANRNTIKRRGEVEGANRDKAEMKDWFAAVLTEVFVPAPDLRGLTLEDAIERSQEVGLRLMVMADSIQMPGVPAGVIISQSPYPGSRAIRGGDLAVTLSRM